MAKPFVAPQNLQQLAPIEPWHFYVKQDQIGYGFFQKLQQLVARACAENVVAAASHHLSDDVSVVLIVLCKENPLHATCLLKRSEAETDPVRDSPNSAKSISYDFLILPDGMPELAVRSRVSDFVHVTKDAK